MRDLPGFFPDLEQGSYDADGRSASHFVAQGDGVLTTEWCWAQLSDPRENVPFQQARLSPQNKVYPL